MNNNRVIEFIRSKFDDNYHKVQLYYSGNRKTLYIDDIKADEIINSVAIQFGTIPFNIVNDYKNI
jgi:hypothetical protein